MSEPTTACAGDPSNPLNLRDDVDAYYVPIDDSRFEPTLHVQGAWLCPTRVALPEMHQRLSRGLDLAADLIDLDHAVIVDVEASRAIRQRVIFRYVKSVCQS